MVWETTSCKSDVVLLSLYICKEIWLKGVIVLNVHCP